MANEIQATYDSGVSLYVLIFNAAGQVWYPTGNVFETFGTLGRSHSSYAIALSEIASNSEQYRGTFPDHANMIAGVYSIVLYLQLSGSPTSTDPRLGETAIMEWDGSEEITRSMMDTVLDIAAADVVNIDGEAIRGTDGANTTVPDAAGVAATPAEVATALSTYGGPTKAEMDTGHGLLATEAKQNTIDNVVDDIKANMLGVKTWFVDKAGNDGSSGKTWKEAFLTIGAAVSASTSGDTIKIGPGTFAENIDLITATKSLRLEGTGSRLTIISQGVDLYSNSIARNLTMSSASTGVAGLNVMSQSDVLTEDCAMISIGDSDDAIWATGSINFTMKRCVCLGNFDSVVFDSSSKRTVIEDSLIFTDGTDGTEPAALDNAGGDAVVRNSYLVAIRDDTQNKDVIAVYAGGDLWLDHCTIIAKITNADSSGEAIGVKQYASASNSCKMTSCKIFTSHASGTAIDILQNTGTISLVNTFYDLAKVTGTITDLTRRSIVSDDTRFAGADIATILGHTGTTIPGSLGVIADYTDTLEASAATIAGYTDTLEAAVAAIPTVVEIDAQLSGVHGSSSWGAMTLGPVVGSRNPGNILGSPISLEMFQREKKNFALTVQDADGLPIDLRTKTLKFITETQADPPVEDIDTSDVAVSGDNYEIATVTIDANESVTAAIYNWRLWDTVADEVLLYGTFTIVSAVDNA